MKDDLDEDFEDFASNKPVFPATMNVLEGDVMDHAAEIAILHDPFFDADYVGKDGIYVPPLDEFSPKMKEIWAPDDPNERTDQAVTLEGDCVRVERTPLLIEHEVDDE